MVTLQFTWLRFKSSISFPKTRNGFPEMELENLTKVLPEVDFLFHEGNPEGLEEMISLIPTLPHFLTTHIFNHDELRAFKLG